MRVYGFPEIPPIVAAGLLQFVPFLPRTVGPSKARRGNDNAASPALLAQRMAFPGGSEPHRKAYPCASVVSHPRQGRAPTGSGRRRQRRTLHPNRLRPDAGSTSSRRKARVVYRPHQSKLAGDRSMQLLHEQLFSGHPTSEIEEFL